jgi:hypothetical protein
MARLISSRNNDNGTDIKITFSDDFKGIFVKCNMQHIGLISGDFHCNEKFTTWVEHGYLFVNIEKGGTNP